jgi:hypothetical protein
MHNSLRNCETRLDSWARYVVLRTTEGGNVKKPVKKSHGEVCYDYNEMIDYIEHKYGIETRGYKQEVDGVYRDFWHWVLDHNNIHNGCYASFPEDWDDDYYPEWTREIMRLIVAEFYPDGEELDFWVSW